MSLAFCAGLQLAISREPNPAPLKIPHEFGDLVCTAACSASEPDNYELLVLDTVFFCLNFCLGGTVGRGTGQED